MCPLLFPCPSPLASPLLVERSRDRLVACASCHLPHPRHAAVRLHPAGDRHSSPPHPRHPRLQYAATQPEPMIGRADDDIFLSPRMLLAHVHMLLHTPTIVGTHPDPLIFAGVFEWYSWRTRTLHSTAFGLTAGSSRANSRRAWRNCTAAAAATWHVLPDYGDSDAFSRQCRGTQDRRWGKAASSCEARARSCERSASTQL